MTKKTLLTGLIHEELEPRLLFSAGLETVLLDDNLPGTESAIIETVSENETEILQLEQNQQSNSGAEPAREVVFIDENVDNYDQLMDDLANKPNTDVYVLDSSVDGIDQISAVLANYDELDAIHIVSHGDESSLQLGNGTLDNNSIESYRNAISDWQSALSEDADLLVYGCDVAASPEGQALISNLQTLTGTDVAASDDTTGHASLGGDWDLEYQAGDIETSIVFSTQVQSNWVGALPAPTVNNLSGDTLNYSEDDGAVAIEQGTDVSTNLSGGGNPSYSTLTISITAGGDTSEDVLSILNQGSGSNQIGFDGTNVSYEGTVIGTVSGGSSGNDLQIIFNSNADNDSVADLIENISYENTDTDNPTTSSRTIDFTVTKSGGGGGGSDSTTSSTTVNVASVNDLPDGSANTISTNEDRAYAFSAADFNFTDVDGDSLASIKITSLESAGSLQLNGVDVALNDVISKADIDAGKLVFTPATDANGAGYDSFNFSVNDGTADSAASYVMSMDVTAANDAPVNGIPGEQFIAEDSTLIFSTANGNAISINDVDANGGLIEVKLAVGKGSLTLSDTTGLTFQQGDGTDDRAVTFTGTADDINAALEGLAYTTDANANGGAVLTIVTNDKGNTGPGGEKTDTDNITINVSEVNDAPTNTVPGDQTVAENNTLVFSTANGNGISINDIDTSSSVMKVSLTVDSGSLNLNGTTGLSFQTGDGTEDSTMIFEGTSTDINNALEGLSYTQDANYTSAVVLSIVTDDQGNVGSGGVKTNTDNVAINISAVNNPASENHNDSVTEDSDTTTESDTTIEDYTVASVTQDETINKFDADEYTVEDINEEPDINETSSDESDIVINVDAEGKPTIELKQGSSELLHSLINNPTMTNANSVSTFSLDNMASEQNITINSVSPWNFDSQLTGNELKMALDELNQQLGSDGRAKQDGEQIIVSTVAGVSIALTAGFVTWALQGGSLLTALMTVLPLWNTFDPLPVLNANADKKNTSANKQRDEIESIFDNPAPATQD